MEHTQVAAWILAAMNHLSPHADHHELATALASQLAEEHGAMSGEQMLKVAAVEVAVLFREGSFITDVTGDKDHAGNATSFCSAQINLPGNTRTLEGWSGRELAERADRCVAVMDRMLTDSMATCAKLPLEERLANYARGSCSSKEGRRISRDRMWLARELTRTVAVPAIDIDHDGEPEAFDVLDLTAVIAAR